MSKVKSIIIRAYTPTNFKETVIPALSQKNLELIEVLRSIMSEPDNKDDELLIEHFDDLHKYRLNL
jgi:hypothetical protein